MATTAAISLPVTKVAPGDRFTALVTLSRDVATEIRSIVPNATRDLVTFGTVDLRTRTFEVRVLKGLEETLLSIGATITLTDNTQISATVAKVLCLGSVGAFKAGPGNEAGSLKFNLMSNGGHAATGL